MSKLIRKKTVGTRMMSYSTRKSKVKFEDSLDEYARVKRLYKFTNNGPTDNYLRKAQLRNALYALYPEIIARFGNIKPRIELTADAEFQQWEILVVTIPVKEKFETAQMKLDDLIHNWVYHQSAEFKKTVTLSIL
jgi:hypothetical protein